MTHNDTLYCARIVSWKSIRRGFLCMPYKPLHKCAAPGCTLLVSTTYCPAHTPENKRPDDKERGTASQRGYNTRWRKYRIAYLAKHPLCAACEQAELLTPSTVVDHIKPHKGDSILFWEKSNHQALCKSCHDQKTAREVGFAGKH